MFRICLLSGALKLLISAALAAFSANAAALPEDGLSARIRSARTLLRSGQVDQALEQAALAERLAPGQAEVAALVGEIHFRKAEFESAEQKFLYALAKNANCAQAHLGLGRLDQLHFRRTAARDRFRQAYSIDPSNPSILRACASVAADPQEEMALLEEYLKAGAGEPREQLEAALGHIQFHRRLGDRKLSVVDGPYRRYRLQMSSWAPGPGPSTGLLLKVSINGSQPLRLVLDTGASGVYVSAKAAAKLGLEHLADSGARGVGETGSLLATKTLARTLRIDDLQLRNCIIEVTDRPVTAQADGVIGASLFEQFILELDARRRTLDLVPYPDGPPDADAQEQRWANRDRSVAPGMEHLVPVCQVGHLLLVNTKLNNGKGGYLVLDTGAAFTSVSNQLAGSMTRPFAAPLAGAGGRLAAAARAGAVRIRIADYDLADTDVITFDFRPVSNQEGVEISGLIGYPVLSRSPLTIDYRNGLIGFARGK
jgi:predicted aspartyl protease